MKKAAFLVGNGIYPGAPLKNPSNDASDLGTALGKLAFTVTVLIDKGIADIDVSFAKFCEDNREADVLLFFFAGHGMQIDGENYLAAIDTKFAREADAKYSSLPLDKVIRDLRQMNGRVNIVILDACRNNPFTRMWRGADRGLAPVYAPRGTIVCFATSPGEVASDGVGRNGAYSEAVLRHIETPDLLIEALFKRVRNSLSAATGGVQTTWEHTSLMGEFCFHYSASNNERLTLYTQDALGDKNFSLEQAGDLGDIVRGLKSHNWYAQNPAIGKLTPESCTGGNRNLLFVLGRNIYQAAVGTAKSVKSFLESLKESLLPYPLIEKQHIVDGMLYEIYFNSSGRFREKLKAELAHHVLSLHADEDYKVCFAFIQAALEPYRSLLLYMPGTEEAVTLNAETVSVDNTICIRRLMFSDGDVLVDKVGVLADPANSLAYEKISQADLKTRIAGEIAAPRAKISLFIPGVANDTVEVGFPWYCEIRRLAK